MTKSKLIRNAAILTAVLAASSVPAAAGPILCMATAAGGGALAIASLFTGPGIFVTGPLILKAAEFSCLAPTP